MKRLAAVVLLLAVAGAAAAYTLNRPDPATQAQADGCARDLSAFYTREAPTWVYVGDRDAPAGGPPPPPQWVKGTVNAANDAFLGSHPSGSDDPVSHDAYDFNINILPDPAYASLLGTGNDPGAGEEAGRLHIERETAALPSFVWPDPGDRIAVLGSFVWDCGHWIPDGERTELHPFRTLWIQRRYSPRSPTGEAEADLYISTEATPAGVIADCGHKAKGDRVAFKACLLTQPRWQDVSGDYSFTLPAPPRPKGSGPLQARVVDLGGPAPTVTVAGTTATVTLHLAVAPGQKLELDKEIFLGWTHQSAATLPQHLRLRFRSLLVRRAMDPGCLPHQAGCVSKESTLDGQISTSPGEWNVYWDVAGIWGTWDPILLRVRDGQLVPGRQTVDFYVPRGTPWRLFAFTRECDFGALAFSNQSLAVYPCPASHEFGNAVSDDVPGVVVNAFRSPEAGIGLHRGIPLKSPSTCPASNPQGCYELDYVVTRVDDAKQRAAR